MLETNSQIELAKEFIGSTGAHIFLTGKAGTGKSTFLNTIAQSINKRVVVAAPTGVAAFNVRGVTLHSLFQLPFAPHIPNAAPPKEKGWSYRKIGRNKLALIRSIELLVIDEISMVRSDVLDAVDETLKLIRRDKRPFGGVQLLMIGDIQQLSPICRDEEWQLLSPHYKSPYFFDSHALQECRYITIELKTIYRQTDLEFTKILNAVRDNAISQEVMSSLNSRYVPNFTPHDDEGYITLTTHNYSANNINTSKLAALRTESRYYDATINKDFPEWAYPNDESLELKVGTQVMFIKNDPSMEKLYYNGMVGQVEQLLSGSVIVKPNDGGESITVEPLEWENIDYVLNEQSGEIEENVKGSFSQIPLKCAWAITIHKSQGLSFDKVIIDAENSFAHGQVYVALSRCRTFEGMVLSSPLRIHSIVKDQTVEVFNQKVLSSEPNKDDLEMCRRDYYRDLLCEIFSFSNVDRALNSITKLFETSLFKEYPKLCITIRETLMAEQSEVYKVGESFKTQISRAVASSPDYINDKYIAERLSKSSEYFKGRIESLLNIAKQISEVTINAKDIKKRATTLTEELIEELTIKLFAIDLCGRGFSSEEYLKRKFEILTQRSSPKKSKETKATDKTKVKAEPKAKVKDEPKTEVKIATHILTLNLLREGKNVEEIAAERSLTMNTIYNHIVLNIRLNNISSLEGFVDDEQILTIRRCIESCEDRSLGNIKTTLGDDEISYEAIKLVKAKYFDTPLEG